MGLTYDAERAKNVHTLIKAGYVLLLNLPSVPMLIDSYMSHFAANVQSQLISHRRRRCLLHSMPDSHRSPSDEINENVKTCKCAFLLLLAKVIVPCYSSTTAGD